MIARWLAFGVLALIVVTGFAYWLAWIVSRGTT